jgi:hypothetical protein
MKAEFILQSIRRKYPSNAIVPEISIEDFFLEDSEQETTTSWNSSLPRPEGHSYIRRIDALMFESYMRTAIEIKVSKADFNRDTYWKRRAWQNVTHRFIYAVPHDLDVIAPHGCGLWKVREDGSIEITKKAIVNKTPEHLPQSVIQRMAYRISTQKG